MKRLIVIVGPTAVGKTAAAVWLASRLHTEIVSCDSRQFYRELNIGVARPTPDELAAVPHHFIANRSVEQPYNIFQYEQEALSLLEKLFSTHDDVVAVGGSGLYVDALCEGVDLMPDPSPELRESLSQKVREGRLDEMLEELRRLDPDCYSTIDRRNPIRVQRALETIITAGKPLSEAVTHRRVQRPFTITKIGIRCQPVMLRERINRRVDLMVQQGLVEEVTSLLPYRHLNTLTTVGYKEIFDYLDGNKTLEQAITDIKNHTWRYAKKQTTWLKHYPAIDWTESDFFSKKMQVFLRDQY